MSYTLKYIKESHVKSLNNKSELLNGKICGCFYCLKIFSPKKIINWIKEIGKDDSAWCPFCEMDTVLSDKFPIEDITFLEQMNSYWFKE